MLDKGVAACADVVINPAIPISACLFYPCAAPTTGDAEAEAERPTAVAVVMFFHGGGFVYLSTASPAYDATCHHIARHTGAVVLSVVYRRSPEHRFPAAYDDGRDPLPRGRAANRRVRCFLTGDSSGGNIAHHVAHRYALDPSAFANLCLAKQDHADCRWRTAGHDQG
jgi:acetyl esterase/lipase